MCKWKYNSTDEDQDNDDSLVNIVLSKNPSHPAFTLMDQISQREAVST